MILTNFLFVTTLLSAVSAVPAPVPQTRIFPDDGIYRFRVTDWASHCDNSECPYEFNIAADEFGEDDPLPISPSFKASCKGAKEGLDFTPCTFTDNGPQGRTLGSRLPLRGDSGLSNPLRNVLIVRYGFQDEVGQRWDYVSNPTQVKLFDIVPEDFNIDDIPPAYKVGPQPG